jgi:mRNA interferase RelE/StbE
MGYSLFFHKKVKKFISELDHSQKDRVKEKLVSFAENPYVGDIKKVRGKKDVFRLRIGDFRILYIFDDKERSIYIVKFDYRKTAYRQH